MEYRTTVSAGIAHVIRKGLEEIGAGVSLDTFVDAVKWGPGLEANESSDSPPDEYKITVTPEVAVGVLEVINGGQLVCYLGSDVTADMLRNVLEEWQKALSMSSEDPTLDPAAAPSR
ncbi:MAG: hypothetical protein ACAI34_16735 [Verrucomicrobium sp.]|nr:hypothetical protein [Verrucomicrobium sp.]